MLLCQRSFQLRIYTRDFAKSLLEVYEAWLASPTTERGDLRVRRKVKGLRTDRELFENMQLSDVWVDSGIHEVVLYLYKSKHIKTLGWQNQPIHSDLQ